MSVCEVRIHDDDRNVTYVLTVPYNAHRAVPSRYTKYGWSEPEAAGVEIDGVVLCTEIVVFCGDRGYSAKPGLDDDHNGEKQAGEHCMELYEEEIQEAVERAASAAAESDADDRDSANEDRREQARRNTA